MKVVLHVLTNRIEHKARDYIGRDLFGFCRGVGIREAIAVTRPLSETYIDQKQDIYVLLMHYEKTFDRDGWTRFLTVLKSTVLTGGIRG